MDLFLSPHNDDETLFGAFTLLRFRPHVIVCLRSQVQEDRGYGITAEIREAETQEAMDVLGRSWEQWRFLDRDPDWVGMERALTAWGEQFGHPNRVFAPAVETDGHPHHNKVGEIAAKVFGPSVTHYLTYTKTGKSSSEEKVTFEPAWIALKLCAMACYTSQSEHPSCAPHFLRGIEEFYS